MNGFNEDFFNVNQKINFPKLNEGLLNDSLNEGEIFGFTHFSVVMNKDLRSAIYVASNVDKTGLKDIKRENHWHYDDRIGKENQLGDEFYKDNPWDRGHLGRRKDLGWGDLEEAKKGDYDSFCWANISLQHNKFNTGIWSNLENWILEDLPKDALYQKLSILTGPINVGGSIEYCGVDKPLDCGVYIPVAFWKVIFYLNTRNELNCISFIMTQKEYLTRRIIKDLEVLKPYQVSLRRISEQTSIIFDDKLYDADVLNTRDVREITDSKEYLIEKKENLILNAR